MANIEGIQVASVEDVKNYLNIDIADDMILANISRAMLLAHSYLLSAVGEYSTTDPKAKELFLMVCEDAYNKTGLFDANTPPNYRRLFHDLASHIRLDLAGE